VRAHRSAARRNSPLAATPVVHPVTPPHPTTTITGPVAEQVLIMENMASSIKTGPDQLASIHKLMIDAVSRRAAAF